MHRMTDDEDPRALALLTSTEGWAMHPQGAYALWRFCTRLVKDGYVKASRKNELLERAANTRDHRGFFTKSELDAREAKDLLE